MVPDLWQLGLMILGLYNGAEMKHISVEFLSIPRLVQKGTIYSPGMLGSRSSQSAHDHEGQQPISLEQFSTHTTFCFSLSVLYSINHM